MKGVRGVERAKSSGYNPEVDFWKLFFAIQIFLFHGNKFDFVPEVALFDKGYLAVEFFFMVSGFFMAAKIRSQHSLADGFKTPAYLKHKVAGFYPQFIAAFFIAFVLRQFLLLPSAAGTVKNAFLGLNEVLLLQMGGISPYRIYNGATWYISAMLIALAVLYPVARRWKDYFFTVGAPLLALVCYAVISHESKNLNVGDDWWHFIYLGTIRAFAGISLGVFCNELCEKIKKQGLKITRLGNVFFMIAELLLLAAIICILDFPSQLHINNHFDYVAVLLFLLFLIIVFSELTGIGQRVKRPQRYKKMAALSLLLYLNHRGVIYVIRAIGGEWSYLHYMFYYVIATVLTMIACYFLTKLGKILFRKISPVLKKHFFQTQDGQEENG